MFGYSSQLAVKNLLSDLPFNVAVKTFASPGRVIQVPQKVR